VGNPTPPGQETCRTTCPISDRNLKRNFAPIDRDAILEALARLPLSSWTYKTEDPRTRHLGPMAQDFKSAFGLGTEDTTILQVDADGVSFAAIQALTEHLKRLEARNAALESEVKALRAALPRRRGTRPGSAPEPREQAGPTPVAAPATP
jgi:hypothetical protein